MIKKVVKGKPDRVYGKFEYQGCVVTFEPDSACATTRTAAHAETARGVNVNEENEAYFTREVAPHVKDAWIDASKKDERDEGVGVCRVRDPVQSALYSTSRRGVSKRIDADLDMLSREI